MPLMRLALEDLVGDCVCHRLIATRYNLLADNELGPDALSSDENLRSEPAGLFAYSFGQFSTITVLRKAQIILDSRIRASLSSYRETFQDDRFQAFGGTVDGRTEARRAGSVNRQIVFQAGWVLEPAQLLGDAADRDIFHPCTVGEYADRQFRIVQTLNASLPSRLFLRFEFYVFKRNIAQTKKIANGVSGRQSAGGIQFKAHRGSVPFQHGRCSNCFHACEWPQLTLFRMPLYRTPRSL